MIPEDTSLLYLSTLQLPFFQCIICLPNLFAGNHACVYLYIHIYIYIIIYIYIFNYIYNYI